MNLKANQPVVVGRHCQDVLTTIYGHPDQAVLYVRDCDDGIKVFQFFTNSGSTLASRHLSLEFLHGDSITQITWLPAMEALVNLRI
jgi:hypothetical protein